MCGFQCHAGGAAAVQVGVQGNGVSNAVLQGLGLHGVSNAVWLLERCMGIVKGMVA